MFCVYAGRVARAWSRRIATVALLGAPNAGKSTLFNRLVLDRPRALVDAVAGTTRDAAFAPVAWAGAEFRLADTGGLGDLDGLQRAISSCAMLRCSSLYHLFVCASFTLSVCACAC